MRVLDLNTLWIDAGEGGVNTYLREKARWLAESSVLRGRSIRHALVVPGGRTGIARIGSTTVYTLKSPRLPANPQHRVLISLGRVAEILREESPDIVEVDTSYVLGHTASRALLGRKAAIIGFHHAHLPWLYTRPGRSAIRNRLARRTEPLAWAYSRWCSSPCDVVAVSTRDMLERLSGRGFPPLVHVPLGVNLDLFRPRVNGSKAAFPGVDPERPVVLYVGRLGREKELSVLFEAHRELQVESGVQLLLAGDGPLRRTAQRFARSRRGVVYAGICPYGERLAELYRAADVLAVPGRSETFSLIVLEASASGLPVVAADAGGPVELCRHGLGTLARAGDARDFAVKLRTALARPGVCEASRRHVEGHYSWEGTFTRLLDVYESVLSKRRPTPAPQLDRPIEELSTNH